MSAFMVGREHIWAIVSAWGEDHYGALTDSDELAKSGQMLWDENKRSVKYRYPDCEGNDLPGLIGCDFIYGTHEMGIGKRHYSPIQILKACDCLDYQSCETEDWSTTEAYRFLENVRTNMIHKLDGYADAHWEIPDIFKPKGPCPHTQRLISVGMPCVECGALA